MYREIHQRQYWKKKALAGLYLIFILATVGEIFLSLNHLEEAKVKKIEVKESVEIPIHLPESASYEFIRIERLQKYKKN